MTELALASEDKRLWQKPAVSLQLAAIPLASFLAVISWQANLHGLFETLQIALAWAVVGQAMMVLFYAFERSWFGFFAYLLHMVAIGGSSLAVAFGAERYPTGLPYDQLSVVGMAGQLMLGVAMLSNGPVSTRVKLDRNVLAICAIIVCSAALIKFGFYIRYVGLSGGHMDIYTEGDAVRDNSPTIIRLLAAGAPLIALLAVTQPDLPRWCRALGFLAIVLEFAIGIRSRPLFIIFSIISLTQLSFKITLPRKILAVFGAIISILAIAALGYFRENNQSTSIDYFWIVIRSLFGVFEASVFSAQLPASNSEIVFDQLGPLLFPTPRAIIDTVAKLLTVTFSPEAFLMGFGYSSSALAEIVMIFGLPAAGLIYPFATFGIFTSIQIAVCSKRIWIFLYGVSVIPVSFYIWRAELWQMIIPAIKALPFILVLMGVDTFARLGRLHKRRIADPPEKSMS